MANAVATRDVELAGMLERISEAKKILRRGDLQEVLQVRDQAELFKQYAKKHSYLHEASVSLSEVAVRAARRAGEFLREMDGMGTHGGNRKSSSPMELESLGIKKTTSHRWQRIASVPEPIFEQYVTGCIEKKRVCTLSAAYGLASRCDSGDDSNEPAEMTLHDHISRLRQRIDACVDVWIEGCRGAIPDVLRSIADELEQEGSGG